MKHLSGIETIAEIRRQNRRALLSFSCGKDSLACWLAIRDHFDEILPYYCYIVPGLEFVEEAIGYYERAFCVKILQVPHYSLYRLLRNYIFQPPERCNDIDAADLPVEDRDGPAKMCARVGGVGDPAWTAVGVRMVDTPMRRLHFRRHGSINAARSIFYPVWDWKKADIVDAIRKSGIKLPKEYRIFGRSFDGINFQFLFAMKKHFPRDYQRVLDWFPLAELELKRHEYAKSNNRC